MEKKFKTSELELKESSNTRLVSIGTLRKPRRRRQRQRGHEKTKDLRACLHGGGGPQYKWGNPVICGIRDLRQPGRHPLKYFVFGGHDGTRSSLTLPVPSPSSFPSWYLKVPILKIRNVSFIVSSSLDALIRGRLDWRAVYAKQDLQFWDGKQQLKYGNRCTQIK